MIIKKVDNRESNFELLRIISMILIILHHYVLHGGLYHQINLNGKFGLFIFLGGKIGVNIFILISGYFLVNSKFKIKKLLKLIGQVYFYSFLIMIISLLVIKNYTRQYIINMSIKSIFYMHWFVRNYIVMYACSPILNKIIKKISESVHQSILIIGFFVLCILSAHSLNTYIWFIYMYFVGAYIRIYNVQFKEKIDKILIIVFFSILLYCVNYYTLMYQRILVWYNCNYIPVFAISVLIFILFKNLTIKNNQAVINYLASLSFGVYLFHDNAIFRQFLWKNIFKVEYFYKSNVVLLILNVLFSTVMIYVIGAVLECFRKKCVEYINTIIMGIKKKELIRKGV